MSIELTWLGHACWLIKHEDHRILLDPYLNDSPTAPMKAADCLLYTSPSPRD